MPSVEERITQLEVNHNVLSEQIKELRAEHKEELKMVKQQINELFEILDKITKTLTSIKWWLVGFVSFMLVEQMGVMEVLKKVVL